MIGLFDSGSGGLTVLRAIRARAPQADIVYFGDIKNAPYGPKSVDELAHLTRRGVTRLTTYGARDVVSACNSVSASFLEGACEGRFIEMTRPTARAMRLLAGARVLLLATEATVRSGIYHHALDPIVQMHALAVPELARLIESGTEESAVRVVVQNALTKTEGKAFDAVLLGCTHYPLVHALIRDEVCTRFGNIPVIDPADAVADEVVQRFDIVGNGNTTFYISEESDTFRNLVTRLFGINKYAIEIV